MLKIGITGGIGSGKSTICHFFSLMEIPVFNADQEAKRIMNESSLIRSKMMLHFGKDIYLKNQTIDRKKLAESGFYEMMDYTILVTAPEQQRIERVMKRDHSSSQQIKERISKQWPDKEKVKLADFIIKNDNRELVLPTLIELDQKFRKHG